MYIVNVMYSYVDRDIEIPMTNISHKDQISITKYKRTIDKNNHYISYRMKQLFTNGNRIYFNKWGKPLCDSIFFNVSHDGTLVVGTTHYREIGIDCIDLQRPIALENISSVFCKTEIPSLKLFCKKEAVVKMIGQGLSFDLQRIRLLDNKVYIDDELIKEYKILETESNNHFIAVCSSFNSDDVELKISEFIY